MDKIYKYIIENNLSGNISSKVTADMLSLLKEEERKSKKQNQDIAVIGIALKTSLAENYHEFWENLKNGKDCIRSISNKRQEDINRIVQYKKNIFNKNFSSFCKKSSYIKEIDKFDYSFFNISPREAQLMDPKERLFLEIAYEAINDAGIASKIKNKKVGVFTSLNTDYSYAKLASSIDPTNKNRIFSLDIIPSRLSYYLNIKGPSVVISTSCSSSLVAVHMACESIKNNNCEQAVVGGISLRTFPNEYHDNFLGIESENDITRPFDNNAEGTNLGEGIAVLVLKILDRAIEDNDQIYGVIKGGAINQDGRSVGIASPNAKAQKDVIVNAWNNSKIDPAAISYIEAHGTGTKIGDPIEIEGIKQAFEQFTKKKQFCAIGSVKSNIGHTSEAAGVFGLIKTLLSLKYKELPPSIHFEEPNKKIDFTDSPVYVNTCLNKWKRLDKNIPLRAGVSSFGITGTNCHVILEEAPLRKADNKHLVNDNGLKIFLISAQKKEVLLQLVSSYIEFLDKNREINLKDICYTSAIGREHFSHRLAFLIKNKKELILNLKNVKEKKLNNFYLKSNKNIFYGKYIASDFLHQRKNNFYITKKELEKSYKLNKQAKNKRILEEIAFSYVKGVDIDWNSLYKSGEVKKTSLPKYPFKKTRCWLEIPEQHKKNNLFHQVKWQEQALNKKDHHLRNDGKVLIFENKQQRIKNICKILEKNNQKIIIVNIGNKYKKVNKHKYVIRNNQVDFDKLINRIKEDKIKKIIHAFTLDEKDDFNKEKEIPKSLKDFKENQEIGVMSLFRLTKAIQKIDNFDSIDLILLSNNVDKVVEEDKKVKAENATLFGLGKSLSLENLNIKCRAIDIDNKTKTEKIVKEINSNYTIYKTAYRNNLRYVEKIKKVDIDRLKNENIKIKKNGVYIITGGMGGIGLVLADYFSKKNSNINLVLISRKKFPKKIEWKKIIRDNKEKELINKIKKIEEIEERGSKVLIYSVDVADENHIKTILNSIKSRFKKIDGVIHMAGVAGDGFIINKNESVFRGVLRPKIDGTWLLIKFFRNENLDFFFFFSSITSIFGYPGQSDYIAANSYLDVIPKQLKRYDNGKNSNKTKVLTINWSAWSEVGMAFNFGINNDGPIKSLTNKKALQAFEKLFYKKNNYKNILVGEFKQHYKTFYDKNFVNIECFKELNRKNSDNKIGEESVLEVYKKDKDLELLGKEKKEKYSEIEEKLLQIWHDVLGYKKININDNFFEVKGDSLLAMQLVIKINNIFKINFQIKDILECPVFKKLIRLIEIKLKNKVKIFQEVILKAKGEYFKLSHAQRRMFVLYKLEPNSSFYNINVVQNVKGDFKIDVFQKAINKLIQRHEAFRTNFKEVNGEPVQAIRKKSELKINSYELDKIKDKEKIRQEEKEIIKKNTQNPFKLETDNLLRISVIKKRKNKHILIISMHHIISDGWSMNIFYRELTEIYNAILKNRKANLPELSIQYKDYAEWEQSKQNQKRLKEQEKYWLKELSGELPVLNLPTDKPRPAMQTYNGDTKITVVDKKITKRIKLLCKKTKTTLFNLMLTVFNVFLHKITGQDNIIVGTIIANRNHNEVQNTIGCFLNNLSIRSDLSKNINFKELLKQIKKKVMDASVNGEYSFEQLIEKLDLHRDISRSPIFNTLFLFDKSISIKNEWKGFKTKLYFPDNVVTKFDLKVRAREMQDDRMVLSCEYNTDLFKKETINGFLHIMKVLMQEVVKNPNQKIAEMKMIEAKKEAIIKNNINNTKTAYPKNKTLHQLFEEQVQKTPNLIAVEFEEEKLTYQELNKKANKLAYYLRNKKKVKLGDVVGVAVDRSLDLAITTIAVHKAGGACLLMNSEYPDKRMKDMLSKSKTKIILVSNDIQKRKNAYKKVSEILNIHSKKILEMKNDNLKNHVKPKDASYIFFTSGSTGIPKGVEINHGGVVNQSIHRIRKFKITDKSVLCLSMNTMFIPMTFMFYTALLSGSKLCIYPLATIKEPKKLFTKINDDRVILVDTPYQIFKSYTELINKSLEERINFKHLKFVLPMGETIDNGSIKIFLRNYNKIKLVYNYGGTEMSGPVVDGFIVLKNNKITYSSLKPTQNNSIYILNQDKKLQPIGISGELYMSGDGLSNGYINNPQKTREVFLPHPFKKDTRIYKTGDLAKMHPDGNIEILGRVDHQIKIRGYRIEPGEIEANLKKHNNIKDAVVIAKENKKDNDKYLVAYYILEKKNKKETIKQINKEKEELKSKLKRILPDYMIPAYFIRLDKFPLNQNGKLDRLNLPEPKEKDLDKNKYIAPKTEIEKKVAKIWQEVLKVKKISRNDNFFNLGGHSLKAIQVVAKINEMFKIEVSLKSVFINPILSEFSQVVDDEIIKKHLLKK